MSSKSSELKEEPLEEITKMPELPKFINPNSYVQNLERISNILGINYINNKNEYIKKFDEEVFDETLTRLYFPSYGIFLIEYYHNI